MRQLKINIIIILIVKEQEKQRIWEEDKISMAEYNKIYKEIDVRERGSKYLYKENLDDITWEEDIRALVKFRCGNLEDVNKYWRIEETWKCVFCRNGKDCIEHYVEECFEIKDWFIKLGNDKSEIYRILCDDELEKEKGETLRKI